MNAWRAMLGSAHMQPALVELDLMPLEAADFACSQAVTIGDQDHGGIAMTTSAHLAGGVHELLDLALGEIAALNCEVFSAWCAVIGYLICHGKSLSCKYDWKNNRLLLRQCRPRKEKGKIEQRLNAEFLKPGSGAYPMGAARAARAASSSCFGNSEGGPILGLPPI